MNPTYDFKGQVALVTGAAMGMGLATARAFARAGAAVVLADRDGALAAKQAARIVEEGGRAIGVDCDVADEARVAAAVDRAVAEYGQLDMAFNNAGIQVPPSDAADEPAERRLAAASLNDGTPLLGICLGAQLLAHCSAERVPPPGPGHPGRHPGRGHPQAQIGHVLPGLAT